MAGDLLPFCHHSTTEHAESSMAESPEKVEYQQQPFEFLPWRIYSTRFILYEY